MPSSCVNPALLIHPHVRHRRPYLVAPSFQLSRARAASRVKLLGDIRTSWSWSCSLRRASTQISAFDFDDDSVTVHESDGVVGGNSYILSSSEGEESDSDSLVNPNEEVDLPVSRKRLDNAESAFTVTAHRIATLQTYRRKSRILHGVLINLGLLAFFAIFLLFFDWWSWRIVRLPLQPFHLTRPFCIASLFSACAGYIYVPPLRSLKLYQILRKEGPASHSVKRGTPTMGGLFFIPVGIIVAKSLVGFSSAEVCGAAIATLGFAAIGLLDDILSFVRSHNNGLSGFHKFFLQVAFGLWFSFWLDSAKISTPYSMKFLVPLPSPMGLLYLGKHYLALSTFCFASMGNGVNLTDGLDGLAGGTAALAFLGMSIAVLPLSPDLSVFGASMAGACFGFLCHNRYKASVFMGNSGSLALGGALAAMASCTGMFFPLFISSGIFVLEVLSVILQVFYFKVTRYISGYGWRVFRMAPFHHHLELCGVKEPLIVAGAYVVSCILSLSAGYVGLISA